MTETLPLVKTAEVEFTQPHAVYRLYDSAGVLLYVGFTRNLGARMAKHEAEQPWWPLVARKTMVWYGTEYAARAAEAIAIAEEDPVHNVVRPAVGDKVPPHGQRKGWNRTPLIAWHPTDPTLKPWLESHAKHIGVNLRELLDRMAADYRTKHERERLAAARPRTRRAAARPGNVAPAAAELARDRARERRDDDAQTESASDIAAFFRTKHDTEETGR